MIAAAVRDPDCRPTERDEVAGLFDALRRAAFDGVGISRLAYTEKESQALDMIEAEAQRIGLHTERDVAANLVATLPGLEDHLPFIACGSHVDSVPQGGNFDGAAGVIAALTVMRRLKAVNAPLRRTIKLYALRGEESARFGKPYLGSSCLFGKLTPSDLDTKAENDGRQLRDCMRGVGIDVDRIAAHEVLLDPKSVAAWVELHIEQGPVLAARNLPIGIVTGIRGNIRHRAVECIGQAGHSGAVPRWLRHDAVFGMCELITHLDAHWRTLLERGHDLVLTSGIVATDAKVNAIARIPELVRFAFEVRSQSKATLDAAYELFLSECAAVSKERGVTFRFDEKVEAAGAAMDKEWVERLTASAASLHLPSEAIASGAGHDAAVFANAGVPSAMIFVRNQNGSHNPREAMDLPDLIAGIDVMHAAIREAAMQ
ncbi:Zn-dependent hydrolase [Mesorhizobium sp. L-8-3]|nr:Zn-dependent hydrolase [Mesorhizobium sp. L-8-3]BCH21013.1 Zn-dependent hydrolase [Mesorhizobium sp. L-8-3]